MALVAANVTRSRRIRLFFDSSASLLASDYTVSDNDIRAVYAVSGNTNACELVLSNEMLTETLYTVTYPGGATTVRWATGVPQLNQETRHRDIVLYGRDLVFDGIDLVETPEGDLATVGGVENAKAALQRRMLGSPLLHAPDYSPDARQYVDGNDSTALISKLEEQALRDDRVKKAVAEYAGDDTYIVNIVLIGDKAVTVQAS